MKTLTRKTKETTVTVSLGSAAKADTGLPFFDHMLGTFARYANLPLVIEAKYDLRHHLMEDVALTVGTFVRKLAPATAARYGERTIPMDEALVQAVIDIGGRAYFKGRLPSKLYTHWFRSFSTASESTLHLRVLRGVDRHHIIEAAFKALGLSLRQALSDSGAVFSTKGSIEWAEKP